MRLLPSLRTAVLLLLAGATGAAAQQSTRHEFADYGFSVDVPTRWAEMPETLVAAFDSAMAVRENADVRTIAGYQMVASPHRLAPPYVMVRVQRIAPMSRKELAEAAASPSRLFALRDWLDYVAQTYGRSYDLRNFTWNDDDAIFWMANSGAEEPYPDLATITGAVSLGDLFVVVAYRTFPSTDLKLARDVIRDVLLSVRPIARSGTPASVPFRRVTPAPSPTPTRS